MQASSYQTSLRILQPDRERSGSVSEDSHLTDGSVSSASHAQAELHESRRQSVEGCSTLAKQHRARTSADRRRAEESRKAGWERHAKRNRARCGVRWANSRTAAVMVATAQRAFAHRTAQISFHLSTVP